MDINTDHSCRMTMDLGMGIGNCPGPDITLALSGKQAIHFSTFLMVFTSSDLHLCTGHKSVSLSHSIYLLTITVHNCPAGVVSPLCPEQAVLGLLLLLSLYGAGQGILFSLVPEAGCPRHARGLD